MGASEEFDSSGHGSLVHVWRYVQRPLTHFPVNLAQMVQECVVDAAIAQGFEKEVSLLKLWLAGEVLQVDQSLFEAHAA